MTKVGGNVEEAWGESQTEPPSRARQLFDLEVQDAKLPNAPGRSGILERRLPLQR